MRAQPAKWKAPSRGYRLDDFDEAQARVGRGEISKAGIAARARWLIDFARRDLSPAALAALPKRERYLLGMEAGLFAKGARFAFSKEGIADEDALREAQARLHATFAELRAGREAVIEVQQWRGGLSIKDGTVTQFQPMNVDLQFLDGFLVQVHNLFPWLQLPRLRLHFCGSCRQPFLTKRPDARTCSTSCRTLAWRKANPENFREWRKAAYRKSVAKRLGKTADKVRIQSRQRKGAQ